jgi:bifunctional enzyme CysN/CysC
MSAAVTTDFASYVETCQHADLLRFITCGSVDDGKSSLLGRLLYESKLVLTDQLAALRADSARTATAPGELNLALLVDGLAAEREQGITIDVAYRYFTTGKRKFIVADTPGHEQYTRNMVTGASTADLAVILVDARKGLLTQTRRYSHLVALLGIRSVVLAVNKIDLVDYSEQVFTDIVGQYQEFARSIGITDLYCVPTSALVGDNITEPSRQTPWYTGRPLLEHLETVTVTRADGAAAFRMPVQHVTRPSADFRGYAGTVVGGQVRVGDMVSVQPAGTASQVTGIISAGADRDEAVNGESVTITFRDEIDVSRGDLLCSPGTPPELADRFGARLVWMDEKPMLPGRPYLVKIGTRVAGATVTALEARIDVNTLQRVPAHQLEMNEIGLAELEFDRTVAADPYEVNRDTGGFIVIDKLSGNTVGAGVIDRALSGTRNLHWQAMDIDKQARARLNGHRPCVIWLTGLSGAGKSTVANLLERRLHSLGKHTYLLDGDNVRHGLNRDLGFSAADRVENIRRVAEVAKLFTDAGLIVLTAFISPFQAEREMARQLVGDDEFCEVFVDVPLEVAEQRDPKGLYRKARSGQLPDFTGIGSPYEAPVNPDVRIDATAVTPDQAVQQIVDRLVAKGILE